MLLTFCTCAQLQITSALSTAYNCQPVLRILQASVQVSSAIHIDILQTDFSNEAAALTTSCSKLYLTGSCMIEKITAWNSELPCNFIITHLSGSIDAFKCSLHLLLLRKGTKWDAGQKTESEKRDPTVLGRLQQYRQIHGSPSCCSSRKYIRERSRCTVCTQKGPLLMCLNTSIHQRVWWRNYRTNYLPS